MGAFTPLRPTSHCPPGFADSFVFAGLGLAEPVRAGVYFFDAAGWGRCQQQTGSEL